MPVQKKKHVGNFKHRTPGRVEKVGEVNIGRATGAFCDIVGDAQGSSAQLFCEAKKLSVVELLSKREQFRAQIGAPSPNLHVLKAELAIFHKWAGNVEQREKRGRKNDAAWPGSQLLAPRSQLFLRFRSEPLGRV